MEELNVETLNAVLNIDGPKYILFDDSDTEFIAIGSWNKGLKGYYKHTEESKSKITGRPVGFNHSEEWKEKKSLLMIGKDNHFYGKTHSEETVEKIIKRHYKMWEFVSPTGEIVKEYTTLRKFCKKYSLDRKSLTDVINGKAKQHKGWTVG